MSYCSSYQLDVKVSFCLRKMLHVGCSPCEHLMQCEISGQGKEEVWSVRSEVQ